MTATATATAAIALDTLATREFAKRQPALEAAMEQMRLMAEAEAESMTKAELTESLKGENVKAGATKAVLTEAYVKQEVHASEPAQELRKLQMAALADEMMIDSLNARIKAVNEIAAKLAKELAADPSSAAYTMTWNGDKMQVAGCVVRYAARIKTALENGNLNLPEIVKHLAKDALRAVATLPSHLLNNGLSGNLRGDTLFEAAGASEFLRDASSAYSYLKLEEMTFTLHEVSR